MAATETGAVRLAAFSPATGWGGAEASLASLLGGLPERYEVGVLGVAPDVVTRLRASRVGATQALVAPVRGKWDLRPLIARTRLLRRLAPDVLHVNLGWMWAGQYATLAGLLTRGTKVVVVQHGAPLAVGTGFQVRVQRALCSRADAVVSVGEGSARELERILGLAHGTVTVIHNGVADRHAEGRRRFEGPPWEDDGLSTLGAIGRLSPEKGFDTIVRCLAELTDCRAVLIGTGPERQRLERLGRDLGVADRLVMPGFVERAHDWLEWFDLFLLPSEFEVFPLTVVEAMLARVPVVAFDVGSVADGVREGETGLLAPAGNHAAFVTAVRRLLEHPERRHEMGALARQQAVSRFTVGAMVGAYERLYDGLLPR